MDVHPQPVSPGKVGHPLPHRGAGGILRVDGGVHLDLPVPGIVPVFIEADVVSAVIAGLGRKILRGPEIHRPAGQIGGDARLQHRLGDGLGVHVHIGDAGGARRNHLRQPQGRACGHTAAVQLGLGGEDVVVEPGMQVAASAVAPHEGHGHVGVGVDKAGHHHLAGAVDHPLKLPRGALRPHRGNFGPLHRHKGVFENGGRRVHGHGGDVGK